MDELVGAASAPSVVQLFGEYGTYYGESGIGLAIDHKLTLRVNPAEFEYHIVDGYKLDEKKHKYFHNAIDLFWDGVPLEFSTSSQMPFITGHGTHSTLTVLLSSLLMELTKRMKDNPKLKKKKVARSRFVKKAYKLEKTIEQFVSPLATTTAVLGGVVLMNKVPKDAVFSIIDGDSESIGKNNGDLAWYAHLIKASEDLSFVIGYLSDDNTKNFSPQAPKPLFNKPFKSRFSKRGKRYRYRRTRVEKYDSVLVKLDRFKKKSGFAKDILKDIGIISNSAVKVLDSGDINKLGKLMSKQQNLITMLGLYQDKLKPIIEAAKINSNGVTLSGMNGDAVVAISKNPDEVVEDIRNVGGLAEIITISNIGLDI